MTLIYRGVLGERRGGEGERGRRRAHSDPALSSLQRPLVVPKRGGHPAVVQLCPALLQRLLKEQMDQKRGHDGSGGGWGPNSAPWDAQRSNHLSHDRTGETCNSNNSAPHSSSASWESRMDQKRGARWVGSTPGGATELLAMHKAAIYVPREISFRSSLCT